MPQSPEIDHEVQSHSYRREAHMGCFKIDLQYFFSQTDFFGSTYLFGEHCAICCGIELQEFLVFSPFPLLVDSLESSISYFIYPILIAECLIKKMKAKSILIQILLPLLQVVACKLEFSPAQVAGALPSPSSSLSIALTYGSQYYMAYENNKAGPLFSQPIPTFSCSNMYKFTLNQTEEQMMTNMSYYIQIQGINREFNITIISLHGNLQPKLNATYCQGSCVVEVWNNCKSWKTYDGILVTIVGVTSIFYNVICDSDQPYGPFQYGLIVLVVFSVLQIILVPKFQQANSYSNKGHYINLKSLAVYCAIILLGQILILVEDNVCNQLVGILCSFVAVIVGIIGIMVCFVEFAFWTGFSFFRIRIKFVRVMDVLGLLVGIGFQLCWFFTQKNWIVSDIIYSLIFVAIVKLIKLDSLKMAVIVFAGTSTLNVLFIILTQTIRKIYFNSIILYIFNNPLFLLCPCLNYTPNQECSWLFLSCIAYPAILLSYFDRFDESRSSRIYYVVYVGGLVTCSALWLLLSHFVSFTLPFQLMNSPVCIGLISLFANRRGELQMLWDGRIYDAKHKHKIMQDIQLNTTLREGRTDSYRSSWFRIRYDSGLSVSSNNSVLNQDKSSAQERFSGGKLQENNKESIQGI